MSTLIQINNLSKNYGPQVIFSNASLTVRTKQKIGVIGRNGAGKSTLFKMIVNNESPDSGTLIVPSKTRLGYLEQHDPFALDETVLDFLIRYTGREEWRCGKMAARFQLKNELLSTPIGGLAGGYQMRVKLTAMLLKDPNLLLLDEPTNYLDLSTLILLERFLKTYSGGFLVISHDREFIQNISEHTLEVEHGNLVLYPGSLEDYLAFKEEQTDLMSRQNLKVEQKEKHLQQFVDRFRAKATKAKQAQSKLKQIAKLKKIEILHPMKNVRIHIPKVESRKGMALRVEDMTIGYGQKIVADGITLDVERGEHVAILGDNGQGKTTLLRTLAKELSPVAGGFTWMPGIKAGYYAQHVPGDLNPQQEVGNYLAGMAAPDVSTQEIYKMAGNFLFKGDELKKQISVLSGGERARLCLAGLLLRKCPVLLLDEPNNHLDFETVEALGGALKKCNSTILFVSHNRTFVNLLATAIIEIKEGKVTRHKYTYEEYVYHLERMTVAENEGAFPEKVPAKEKKVSLYEQKKQLKSELRKYKKERQTIERTIETHAKEKDGIIKSYETDPAYSPERNKRFDELSRLIENNELKWLELQEKIEGLTKKLEGY